MTRPEYPKIAPVPEGVERPFWSVMIPTFNRIKYLERTLHSVLEQDFGPQEMQIEVVDNASTTDEVEALVRRVGGDRVKFFRQSRNVGLVNNWNTCINRARGQWVHILHDDDVVDRNFYQAFRSFVDKSPTVGMVFCRSIVIDEEDEWECILPAPPEVQRNSIVEDSLFKMITDNPGLYIRCPAVAIARRVYEITGGFDTEGFLTIDWQMYMRVSKETDTGYLSHPLAFYRVHQNSVTNDLAVQRDLAQDFERSLNCGIALLPKERRAEAKQKSFPLLTANVNEMRNKSLRLQRPEAALQYSVYLYRKQRSAYFLGLVFKDYMRVIKKKLSWRHS